MSVLFTPYPNRHPPNQCTSPSERLISCDAGSVSKRASSTRISRLLGRLMRWVSTRVMASVSMRRVASGVWFCATNAWTPSRCGPLLNSWLFHKLVKIDVGERKSRTVELTQNVEVWIQLKASKVIQCSASTHNERRFEAVHFIGLKWAVLLYSAFKQ